MATSLYDNIIFGPVRSRRLGLSLGVNLLPLDSKLCSFDCIYCECGWTPHGTTPRFNSRENVARMLEDKLMEMSTAGNPPDVITFAGNGEPTMHPEFEQIIEDTLRIRDSYAPNAKVSVLSNATQIGKESVRRTLNRVDNNILKLDSALDKTVALIDNPRGRYSVAEVIDNMKKFNGNLIVQTLFLRGTFNGQTVDNTTPEEVSAWLDAIGQIAPKEVMIYSLDRDTPAPDLQRVYPDELATIADRVREMGIQTQVAG